MLYYLLIIIFLILYAFLTCKNIKTGIYLIILFLPTYLIRFKIGPIPFTLLEGMILILFFGWLFKIYKSGGRLNFNIFKPSENNPIPKIFRWPIIFFLITSTIAAFISPNLLSALGIWKAYFLETMMFFIVFIYTIKDIRDVKNIIYSLEILVITIGFFAIIQKITGALIPIDFWREATTRRVTTFFGYPNANSLLIAPIILLILGNFITDLRCTIRDSRFAIRAHTILNLTALALGILTIIYARSAGAVIGVLAGVLFLLLYYKKTRLITVLGCLILLFFFLLSPASPLKQKINYQKLDLNSTSLEIRLNQWSETIKMLKGNPINGAGLTNYQNKFKPYHKFEFIEIFLYPHNIILNFWTEIGLFGVLSFCWLIIAFFIYGFKKLKEADSPILQLTIIGAMITLLVHGLVDVPYFKNDLAILFWIIVALPIIFMNNASQTDTNDTNFH